jgi:hypothetical protein
MNRAQVDAALLQWDGVFNARQTRRVRTPALGTLPERAIGVRRRLGAIVRRTPQAMVRISGGGRGMRAIRAHLDYISRHGRLALIGEDGDAHLGQEELAWLAYEWQSGGVPIAERSGRREALNIVLSMPAGTDAAGVLRAARAFAQDEFGGHQYALVLHRCEDDPGQAPSPHPHVHLCVKMAGADGARLNPRKPDLRRWRARFAERLREHGIDAAASGRLERFERQPRYRQGAHHLRQRGAAERGRPALPPRPARHELPMLQRYGEVARLLAGSSDAADRALAVGLAQLCGKALERGRDQPDRAR